MADRKLTLDELTELLEQYRPERAGNKTSPEIADARIQLLFARVAALTGALRAAESDETARLAARMMLSDLAAIAEQFRGQANTMRAALAKALAELRAAAEAPSAKSE